MDHVLKCENYEREENSYRDIYCMAILTGTYWPT